MFFQMIFDEEEALKKVPVISDKLDIHHTYVFKCNEESTIHKIMCEDWELHQSSRSWSKHYMDQEMSCGKNHIKNITKTSLQKTIFISSWEHIVYSKFGP